MTSAARRVKAAWERRQARDEKLAGLMQDELPLPPQVVGTGAPFLRKLVHILFGWVDDVVKWLKEIQEQAGTPIDVPFSPGLDEPGEDLLPSCMVPFGIQYANPQTLYKSIKGLPNLGEYSDQEAQYMAHVWTNYHPPYTWEGVVVEDAKGTPPIEISDGIYISAQLVQLTESRWERTMFVENEKEILLYIASQAPSGEWEPGELVSRIEKMGDVCE